MAVGSVGLHRLKNRCLTRRVRKFVRDMHEGSDRQAHDGGQDVLESSQAVYEMHQMPLESKARRLVNFESSYCETLEVVSGVREAMEVDTISDAVNRVSARLGRCLGHASHI